MPENILKSLMNGISRDHVLNSIDFKSINWGGELSTELIGLGITALDLNLELRASPVSPD